MEIKNKLTVTRSRGGNGGKKGKCQSSQGTCIKDPWTKTMGVGWIECGKWGVGRAGESNGGKMGTSVIEQ